MHAGSLQLCPTLYNPVGCGLPGFSVREVLPECIPILECIGQYWLPYPSRALYFLLPWPPNPLSNWCCQNPCNPSSTPAPLRGKHKPSRAASGAKPQWMTHMERWK